VAHCRSAAARWRISGATGVIYGIGLLEVLRGVNDAETHLGFYRPEILACGSICTVAVIPATSRTPSGT
jgi:hypothetical protein